MNRSHLATSLILTAAASLFAVQGCNTATDLPAVPPQPTTGGTPAVDVTTGGTSGVAAPTGGSAAVAVGGGGTPGPTTGGTPGVTPATGGTPAVGLPTGGTPAVGQPTGGRASVATGGSPVTVATGGAHVISPTTGGTPGVITETGGAPVVTAPTGGAGAVNTGKTVTFTTGKAAGAMSGWAYIAMGATDTASDPTCGTAKALITEAAPCTTTTNWSTATSICVTGNVPIADAPTYASWGLALGVNASATAGVGLGQAFTSVAIAVTGSPLTGLRATVHKAGEAASVSYCAALTPGTAIPLTSFITDCYNGATAAGTKITAADVPNIDKISVQVSSGTVAIPVTNLCITGITFS